MVHDLMDLFRPRQGHFELESGHHGSLWIDLELLCLRPEPVASAAGALADRLRPYRIDAICSPLVEGAFVGMFAAKKMSVDFTYTIPQYPAGKSTDRVYSVPYRAPDPLRDRLQNRRVAIVNDVINAGSAVRATFQELQSIGAQTVVVGTLLVLGNTPQELADRWSVDLITLAELENKIYLPNDCPMCQAGERLEPFSP